MGATTGTGATVVRVVVESPKEAGREPGSTLGGWDKVGIVVTGTNEGMEEEEEEALMIERDA